MGSGSLLKVLAKNFDVLAGSVTLPVSVLSYPPPSISFRDFPLACFFARPRGGSGSVE